MVIEYGPPRPGTGVGIHADMSVFPGHASPRLIAPAMTGGPT